MSERKTGASMISEERDRQIRLEGWTPEHDDDHHSGGELGEAAACYLLPDIVHVRHQLNSSRGIGDCYIYDMSTAKDHEIDWPWDGDTWKPTPDDPIRQLTKAGALIAAEIDRLIREADSEQEDS